MPDPDDLADIRISVRAREAFCRRHGGSDSAAQVQLRTMLEDFIGHSARTVGDRYVRLARDGFQLVLTSDLSVVTDYSTVHRERTWAQVGSGVRSRFGKPKKLDRPRLDVALETVERGPSLPPGQVAAAVNPGSVHLTVRVLLSYRRLTGMTTLDAAEISLGVRAALGQLTDGVVDDTRKHEVGGFVDIVAGELRWLVRDDARSVIGVARARALPNGEGTS